MNPQRSAIAVLSETAQWAIDRANSAEEYANKLLRDYLGLLDRRDLIAGLAYPPPQEPGWWLVTRQRGPTFPREWCVAEVTAQKHGRGLYASGAFGGFSLDAPHEHEGVRWMMHLPAPPQDTCGQCKAFPDGGNKGHCGKNTAANPSEVHAHMAPPSWCPGFEPSGNQ
jgi:hypothetical protein